MISVTSNKVFIFIAGGLLLISLLIASYNSITINLKLERTYNDALTKISATDDTIRGLSLADKIDSVQIKKNIYLQDYQAKEWLRKTEKMKNYIFDANTITFLVSFVLVFLGGILFNNEIRVAEQVKKMKQYNQSVEEERNFAQLLTKLQFLQSLTLSLHSALTSNKYMIDETVNFIVNRIYGIIVEDKLKIHDTYKYLSTKEKQDRIYKIIANAIYAFETDRIEKNYQDPNNYEIMRPVIELKEQLEEILEEVRNMKLPEKKI